MKPTSVPQACQHFIVFAMAFVAVFATASIKAAEADDQIIAAAQKSYVFRTFLAGDKVKTESIDGVVTLTGTVSEDSHRMIAQEIVSNISGVKRVDNQLMVKDSPPAQSDTWLYMKVKSTLAYHWSVSAYNTQVELKQGVVTLKGEASSLAQKELAAEYAGDVEGVKAVKNEMTVVAGAPGKPLQTIGEMIDDASITAQARMALLSHRSTSAFNTSVSTSDGIVTVGGKAKNIAEKSLVTKLVTDINGVKSVINNMIIDSELSVK